MTLKPKPLESLATDKDSKTLLTLNGDLELTLLPWLMGQIITASIFVGLQNTYMYIYINMHTYIHMYVYII